MPTARPIIIEKFIDHTDNGVIAVRRCRLAKPTAMPTRASRSGRPAASSIPNATNNKMRLGRPLSSSALCSACSLIELKSLQIGHSPVTFACAPGGRRNVST